MTAYTPKHITIGFLVRDHGFTQAEAIKEIDVLFASPTKLFLKDHYLTVSRVGLRALGGRYARASVYMTAENALNHATDAKFDRL